MKIDENNFIKQLENRNQKALYYVMEKYGWVIKSIVKKHMYNMKNMQGECINDILLGVWNNIESFECNRGDFKNWLAGICRFKCIDYKRKYLKELNHENINDLNISRDDVEEKALENELSSELESLLDCLSEKDRDIFYKAYVEKMDVDEVSREFGVKKHVIYNRISRSRIKIRNIFSLRKKGGAGCGK